MLPSFVAQQMIRDIGSFTFIPQNLCFFEFKVPCSTLVRDFNWRVQDLAVSRKNQTKSLNEVSGLKIDGCMHPLPQIDGCSCTRRTRTNKGPASFKFIMFWAFLEKLFEIIKIISPLFYKAAKNKARWF